MKAAIHWFRRDLRVSDNTALQAAASRAERIVPVLILEDALRTGPDVGPARLEFLLRSAESLRKNLLHLGYKLVVRRGRSEEILPQLARETGAEVVFCNQRYEPYTKLRDDRIRVALKSIGVGFEVFKDAVLWHEREILTQAGNPFTVFTPYSKAWKARPQPPPIRALTATKLSFPEIKSDPMPLDSAEFGHPCDQELPEAGERAAHQILKNFLANHVLEYAKKRDFPFEQATSQLSPHLRCGNIGIRTVLAALGKSREGADAEGRRNCDIFLNELIWREFYLQVLSNFPHVTKGCFRPEYDALQWSGNRAHFQAWCEGRTGYPIVDAAMRCLNRTGRMHNRLRMIVAMFLTKDLLINWQWGERYFMEKLVDGDMAANNGGWQWSAGTGTDAAPYFRIFNPVSQAMKFDPDGKFVRLWVPELAGLPAEMIHAPWTNPLTAGAAKYPARVVIHEEQRAKCLAMFKAVR